MPKSRNRIGSGRVLMRSTSIHAPETNSGLLRTGNTQRNCQAIGHEKGMCPICKHGQHSNRRLCHRQAIGSQGMCHQLFSFRWYYHASLIESGHHYATQIVGANIFDTLRLEDISRPARPPPPTPPLGSLRKIKNRNGCGTTHDFRGLDTI
jgi:hypothetical protein